MRDRRETESILLETQASVTSNARLHINDPPMRAKESTVEKSMA